MTILYKDYQIASRYKFQIGNGYAFYTFIGMKMDYLLNDSRSKEALEVGVEARKAT